MGRARKEVDPTALSLTALRKLCRRWERKTDRALSEYIRQITVHLYKVCPICNTRPVECCFHFISRKRRVLRWEVFNVIGACKACNKQERYWPDLSRAWYIKAKGADRYLLLVEASKTDWRPVGELDRQGLYDLLDYLKDTTSRFQKLKLIGDHFVDTRPEGLNK